MNNVFEAIWHRLFGKDSAQKNVALVLSGGGARGWAHIGAIESLLAHGYSITSVAGTSIGALVGGLYAAGKLPELKETALGLNRKKILRVMDLSPGLDHVATGKRLMMVLDELVGNTRIEHLSIPFCCSASDVVTGKEKVFREGRLKSAIRASISIPGFFKPVYDGNHIYVDGSVHNTLPLDRVTRHRNDLLVAVNVSAPDKNPDTTFLKKTGDSKHDTEKSAWNKIPFIRGGLSANAMNMSLRVTKLSIQNNTQMAIRLSPPDILAELPMDTYSLFDFDKAAEIIEMGRRCMDEALEKWHGDETN